MTPEEIHNLRLAAEALEELGIRSGSRGNLSEQEDACSLAYALRDIAKRAEQTGPLTVGTKVHKLKGYRFPGTVVAVFQTTAGLTRVVVEADHPDFTGMLHIYNPEQLEMDKP